MVTRPSASWKAKAFTAKYDRVAKLAGTPWDWMEPTKAAAAAWSARYACGPGPPGAMAPRKSAKSSTVRQGKPSMEWASKSVVAPSGRRNCTASPRRFSSGTASGRGPPPGKLEKRATTSTGSPLRCAARLMSRASADAVKHPASTTPLAWAARLWRATPKFASRLLMTRSKTWSCPVVSAAFIAVSFVTLQWA